MAAQSRGRSTASLDSAATWLAAWDRRYVPDDEHVVLFEAAMRQLVSRTWDELTVDGTRRVATPSSAMLLNLLHDSASAWWDDQRTSDVHEDRDAVLVAALTAAHDSLVRRFGQRGDGWRWGKVGATRIMHLLGLPAFSERDVAVQGGPGTLNPSSAGGHGPSWRMVVELGDSIRAWGTYPGGQSGNPFSPRYTDRLPLWRAGELDTLFAPRDTLSLASKARLRLIPAR
jgi:penicillin amidase